MTLINIPDYIVVKDLDGEDVAYLSPKADGLKDCWIDAHLDEDSTLSFQLPLLSAKWAHIGTESRFVIGNREFIILKPDAVDIERDSRGQLWGKITAMESWKLLDKRFITVNNDSEYPWPEHRKGDVINDPDYGWIPPDELTIIIISGGADLSGGLYTPGSAAHALHVLLKNSGWTLGTCDVDGTRDLEIEKESLLYCIKEVQNIWGGHILWNSINKTVSLRDEDTWAPYNGFQVRYAKNLKHITRTVNNDIVTRLYPFGENDLDIYSVNTGIKYLENFSYTNVIYAGIYKNQEIFIPAELKTEGTKVLSKLCQPRYSYHVKMVDVRVLPEYSHEHFQLGDMADVIDDDLIADDMMRIIRHRYNVFMPWQCDIDVGEPDERFVSRLAKEFDTTRKIRSTSITYNLLKGVVDLGLDAYGMEIHASNQAFKYDADGGGLGHDTITLVAVAVNITDMTYKWYLDNVEIIGETTDTLVVSRGIYSAVPVTYKCEVSGKANSGNITIDDIITILRIKDGSDGGEGDSIYVEYSIDGLTLWHFPYTAGDIYMRTKVGVSGAWSDAIRIVGEDGAAGSNGIDAQYVVIVGAQVFKYAGGSPTPTTITLSASLFGGLTTYSWQYWNGTAWANLSGTQNQQTYALAHDNAAWGTDVVLRVRCLSNDDHFDEITMVKLYDGSDGNNGTDGANGINGVDGTDGLSAITGIMSNHAHTLPASSTGVVSDYSGSGCTIRVYEGTTALTFHTTLANGRFTVGTPTVNPTGDITVGGRSGSGTALCTVANHTAMNNNTDVVTVTYPLTIRRAGGGDVTFNLIQTITKSKAGIDGVDGADAKYVVISGGQVFKYVGGSPTPSAITLSAALFGGLTTYSWQYWSGTEWVNLSGTQNQATYALNHDNTAWGSNLTLRVRCLSNDGYFDEKTMVKVSDGADGVKGDDGTAGVNGVDGTDGLHAITGVLSNHAHTVPASTAGVVSSYAGSGGTIRVFEGTTALTFHTTLANGRFTVGTPIVSPSGHITVGARSGSGTALCTIANHSAMNNATDSVTITYPITVRRTNGGDVSFDLIQTITKSKTGQDGQPGANAKYVIITGEQVFKYIAGESVPTPTSITLTANLFGGLTVYDWEYWNGTAWVNLSGTQNLQTYALSYDNTAWGSNIVLRVRCLSNDGIFDEKTMVKIYDGANGIDGVDGTNGVNGVNGTDGLSAITGVLSNHAHTVPASSAGVVSSYVGSGGTIRVFEGTTALTFHTSLANGRFIVGTPTVNPSGDITVGARSGSGTTTCTIAVHSGMNNATDIVTITYPLTIRRLGGGDVAFDLIQTITKSKTGTAGIDAKLVKLVSDSQMFHVDTGGVADPVSINITANLQNLTGDVTWTTDPVVTLTGTGNTRTLTYVNMGVNNKVKITASHSGLSDTTTIVNVFDGDDGAGGTPGLDGKDAFTVFLTNESHTYPADKDGNVIGTFNPGYCQTRVYHGSTLLTCSSTSTVAPTVDDTYRITVRAHSTGITSTVAIVSSQYEVRPATFTVDNATITLTITARVGGINTSFTKVISYSKSRAGTDGSAGDYTEYIFIRSVAQPATPTGNSPVGWSDAPPAPDGDKKLWMSRGKKSATGDLIGTWSTPVQIEGEPGGDGVASYSAILTNEHVNVPANRHGEVISYADAYTTFVAWEGITRITEDCVLEVSSVSDVSITYSLYNINRSIALTAMGNALESGHINLLIKKGTIVVAEKMFTFAKLKQGMGRIFYEQPFTPYDLGDLWIQTGMDMRRCTTARATGSYVAGDWSIVEAQSIISATLVVADGSTSQNIRRANYVVPAANTSAQTYINQAINALPAAGGKVILLEGTYYCNGDIVLINNVTLEGQGRGTVIRTTSGASTNRRLISAVSKSNITIQNLRVYGGGKTADNNETGIYFHTCNEVTITGVHVSHVNGQGGIFAEGTSTAFVMNNCTIYDNFYAGCKFSVNRLTVVGNICYNNGRSGIHLGHGINLYDATVTGNVCYNNGDKVNFIGCGIELYLMNAAEVAGNVCYQNATGINCQGNDNNISANLAKDNSNTGIGVYGDRCNIVGNTSMYNSKGQNLGFHGMVISGNYNNVHANIVRRGDSGNRHAYGISIELTGNFVSNNDLYLSGMTGSLYDGGTSTRTTAGNRL